MANKYAKEIARLTAENAKNAVDASAASAQILVLQGAKKILENALDNFRKNSNEVVPDLASYSSTDWNGKKSLRYLERISEFDTKYGALIVQYEDQETIINNKITELQRKVDALGDSMGALANSIESLMKKG